MTKIRLKNWTLICLLAIAPLLVRCVTSDHGSINGGELNLPVAMQPQFAACTPTDGSVRLDLVGGGKNISDIELVWNIPQSSHWDMQFNSTLGDTRLEIQRRQSIFATKGEVNIEIAADKNGQLSVEGNRLPLLDTEFPCLLAGKWPSTWLSFLKSAASNSRDNMKLVGNDSLRSVVMESKFSKTADSLDSCAVIQWGGFLGFFKHSSKLCVRRKSNNYFVELVGPSDYIVKWSQENEPQ